jgi:hypothetical protein
MDIAEKILCIEIATKRSIVSVLLICRTMIQPVTTGTDTQKLTKSTEDGAWRLPPKPRTTPVVCRRGIPSLRHITDEQDSG